MNDKKRNSEDNMVNSEKKTRDLAWLKLRDYHVVALKPEFDQHAIELEFRKFNGRRWCAYETELRGEP